MHKLWQMLADQAVLRGLGQAHLTLLAGCASTLRFEPGEFLCREGDEANAFFILHEGQVDVEVFLPHRGPVSIATLGAGELLGWSWLTPPYHWQFDARARVTTRVIALDARCLRVHCDLDHDLGYELYKRFSGVFQQRLMATRQQLLDLADNP